jgi:hypothetical protein
MNTGLTREQKQNLEDMERFFDYFNKYSDEKITFVTCIEHKIPAGKGTQERLNLSDEAYSLDHSINEIVNNETLVKFYDRRLKDGLSKGNTEKTFILKEIGTVKELPKQFRAKYKYPYIDWLVFLKEKKKSLKYQSKSEDTPNKSYPPLPDCFIDKNYFDQLLQYPKVAELYIIYSDKSYNLKNGRKAYLGGLAHKLNNIGKLNKDIIKTNQDLARVFCPYFHVKFNNKEEKQFQPDRAKIDYFDFIK